MTQLCRDVPPKGGGGGGGTADEREGGARGVFVTQVSAVTGFWLEIQMCHAWFEGDVRRLEGRKKKKEIFHTDETPCQETSRGNNQHVHEGKKRLRLKPEPTWCEPVDSCGPASLHRPPERLQDDAENTFLSIFQSKVESHRQICKTKASSA